MSRAYHKSTFIGTDTPSSQHRSSLIEIDQIRLEKTMELLLMENQEMIQAFSLHASQKAFTNGIRSRRPVRRSKDFDATRCCHSCEIRPEFAVIISNQISRPFSIRSRFAQLLCDPGISRGSRHIHMDHLPRL